MNRGLAIRLAAAAGFLAVALGAFGAHGLEKLLETNGTADTWQTAVFYHFVHSLTLFILAERPAPPKGPLFCFGIGIVLFSGSLYLLAVTDLRLLGAITPFGGLTFLAGWFWLLLKPANPTPTP